MTTITNPRLRGPGEGAPTYGYWIVTVDHVAEGPDDELNRVGTAGPGSHEADANVPREVEPMRADPRCIEWQTRDDDGNLTHEGVWIEGEDDAENGLNPLYALSMPDAGAVGLWLRIEGEWRGYLG